MSNKFQAFVADDVEDIEDIEESWSQFREVYGEGAKMLGKKRRVKNDRIGVEDNGMFQEFSTSGDGGIDTCQIPAENGFQQVLIPIFNNFQYH